MDEVPGRDNVLAGIGWMTLSGLMFVAVTGIVRHLGSDLPAVQAAFLRYAFGIALILPLLLRMAGSFPRGRTLVLCVVRGVVHGGGVMLWFYAMARIPIAEVTAIGYTAPIFTTVGAALFLGERLHARRVAAVVAGFIGVLIILRPGLTELELGSLAQLLAAPLFAASILLAKRLTDSMTPSAIVVTLSIFCTLTLIPGAVLQWRTPTATELFWLFLTAAFATAGHYALTRAFAAAPITVTQPVTFLQLVWAAALGVVVFGEPLEAWVVLGGAVIIGAATYISHREAKLAGARSARRSQPSAL